MNLNDRQKACVLGIATGKTRKEIAAELGLSLKTVDFHLLKAGRRLGIGGSNYAAMTHWAIREGMVQA